MLSESWLGYSRVALSLNSSEEISSAILSKFINALERLKNQEPIQYIIGVTEFCGLSFHVSPATLIPRPETEELVDWIIQDSEEQATILDIGTGSGCIAVTLAHHLNGSVVSAIDVSEQALEIAARNAEENNVAVQFIHADILTIAQLPAHYDIIVSNPPYVRNLEKTAMSDNVLRYEPATALFVSDDDPLRFYRKISLLAKTYLREGGSLYFEINEYLGEELIIMLKNFNFKNVELRQDFRGRDRFIKCTLSLNE